jgi:anhydro-N-acetylmuramic acid kinase
LGGNGDFFSFTQVKLKLQSDALTNENKALCVAFMGVLRWREENNFLSSFTGASRNSIGGAIWMGQGA